MNLIHLVQHFKPDIKSTTYSRREISYILATVFFSFFYILKQTFFANGYMQIINTSLFLLILFFTFSTFRSLFTFKKYVLTNSFLTFLFLFLISSTFLQLPSDNFVIFIKSIFFLCFLILTLMNLGRFNLLIIYADSYLVFLLLVVCLSYFNLIQSYTSQTELWVKNFSGFLNPNVPSFFIFSISCCYFALNLRKRFLLSIVVFLIMLFIGTYSRTSLAGMIFLLVFFFTPIKFLHQWIKSALFFSAISSLFLNILFVCLSITGNEFISVISKTHINTLLSNRLAKIAHDSFERGFFWYDLKVLPFDGIHYELIFSLGFLSLFYFIYRVATYFFHSFKNLSLSYFNISVSVLIIIGSFEGIFAKITPGSFILFSLFLISFKNIDRLFLLKNEHLYG